MAFPFEQIGIGLRMLSFSGDIGNIAAVILYLCLCLLPVFYFIFRTMKHKTHIEDALLILLSILLFAVIYMMINPSDIAKHFGTKEFISMNKSLLGLVVYSVIIGYFIFRALRMIMYSTTKSMLNSLNILLSVICIGLTFYIFCSGFWYFLLALDYLSTGYAVIEQGLSISYIFLVLQYIINILPYVLNIVIIIPGFELIEELKDNPYGEKVGISAKKISNLCKISIIVIILTQIILNLFQLILGLNLRFSNYTLSIPLPSVVFVLVAMILSRYFEETKKIKDDSDMII